MKILVLFAGLLGYTIGMLSLRRAPIWHRSNTRCLYSTNLVQFDPAWQRAQLVRPHLHKLTRPIANAIQASSWYHETDQSSGAPLYLTEYGKYYGTMVCLRAIYLLHLPSALRQNDQDSALQKWVSEASICTTQIGLPTKSIQLLQVQYLDLFLFAKKLYSQDERFALAEYIEENIPRLVQAHKQEIYKLFIKGYSAAQNQKKFLQALALPFIQAQMKFGIEQVLEDIARKVPEIDIEKFCKLRTMAIRRSKSALVSPTETFAELEHRHFIKEAMKHPDPGQRDALIRSGELYLKFSLEIEEIVKYVRDIGRTLGHDNDIAVRE